MSKTEWAVIFDVDGVLLELTRAEEELFFEPFASRCDAERLSRDWNSYAVRNDENIIAEIVERYSLPQSEATIIASEYLALLERRLEAGVLRSQAITGATELIRSVQTHAKLGIATANFRKAAELRLTQTGLWHHVSALAYGADGGGHKSEILARAIKASGLPTNRIIFIGDNVNDVKAGLENNVHFIGFSESPARLKVLAAAGAQTLSANHQVTTSLVMSLLNP